MTLVEWILLVVGVLAVVGLAALIALAVAVGLARRPDRAAVAVIDPDGLDEYFDRVRRSLRRSSSARRCRYREVFGRLSDRAYLSSLPFLQGPVWLDSTTSSGVGVGATNHVGNRAFGV